MALPSKSPTATSQADDMTKHVFQEVHSVGNILSDSGSIQTGLHYLGNIGTAPVAAAGANNGTSPPVPVVSASATDNRGNITFGSGGSAAAGIQVGVTFNTAYTAVPVVMLIAKNDATQVLGLSVTVTATAFNVVTHGAPTASQPNTTYSFDYVVMG